MLGAIIGDIVGSRWEFNPTNNYDFELFSNKNDFTDDTICTIAVADAILHAPGDFGKYIHKWCRKYPLPMGGYGNRFAKWVASDDPQPYGSFGNGAAMRVSPIGWWFDYYNDLFRKTKASVNCTHNHPESFKGALSVVLAINGCREYRRHVNDKYLDKENILKYGLYNAIRIYEEDPMNFKLDLKQYANKFDETCQGTVPVALWIVLNSMSFEDAIRKAVSLGADADTLGAITGSIAEALWGIPKWMEEKALSYLPKEMKEVVFEFQRRTKKLEELAEKCKYFKYNELFFLEKTKSKPFCIERQWVYDMARSNELGKKAELILRRRDANVNWMSEYATPYGLPLSLIAYIVNKIAGRLTSTYRTQKLLKSYLNLYYNTYNIEPLVRRKR